MNISKESFDKALDDFKSSTGFDFLDVLTNQSLTEAYYNSDKVKDLSRYLETAKDTYNYIQQIKKETLILNMKYKCIKGFVVDSVDGDGFLTENDGYLVKEGTIWEINEEAINVLGADVHIENDEYGWLEISNEALSEYFEKMCE